MTKIEILRILSKPAVKFLKAVDRAAERSTTTKVEAVKKSSVRYAELYRKPLKKPNVGGNQRNWNNLKSQELGPNFIMKNKACFKCGDFNHIAYDCRKRVKRELLDLRIKLMRVSHPNLLSTDPTDLHKDQNFPPVNRKLPIGNSNVSTVCCCCLRHVNTARPKAVINRRNWVNDVKASACWIWKPVKSNSASIILKRYDYVDVRGGSRSVMAWVPKKD
nr:ubiquitin hydrolase [Tanacetum cinerariifolium]